MPYNIADPGRDMQDLVVRDAETFIKKNNINLLTGHGVTYVNRETKEVSGTTSDGRSFLFSYDILLMATGSSPVIPDLPGFDLPGVLPLKSLEQGKKIKAFLVSRPVKKAVIIGMGYIGLEMCEALRARSIEVDMVKPGRVILPWMTPDLAEVVRSELKENRVGLYPGHTIKAIKPHHQGLKVCCDGLDLKTDLVIVAVGVKPNAGLASDAGLETGVSGSISVDTGLRTSDSAIYAAGDCSDAIHVVTGKKCWIPLALRANRAGWAVADIVCGRPTHLQGVAGTAVFKLFSLEVARTGLSLKEAVSSGFDPEEVTIRSVSRAHSYSASHPIHVSMVGDKPSGRLLGVQMVGREGVALRINAPAVALHNRMTVFDFSQTDLAYAPPFGPTWDPVLTAANQLLKKL